MTNGRVTSDLQCFSGRFSACEVVMSNLSALAVFKEIEATIWIVEIFQVAVL